MFCERCGTPVHEGDKFCGACGARVSSDDRDAAPIQHIAKPSYFPQDAPAGGGNRKALTWTVAMGALLVLLAGTGAVAYAAFGPGVDLLGSFVRQPVNEEPPAQASEGWENTAVQGEVAEKKTSATSKDSTITKASAVSEEELRRAVEDYYEAVDREDWDYTWENLDSQTKQEFTKGEWEQKNRWFANNYPQELEEVEVGQIAHGGVADVTVKRTFKDGSSATRDTQFFYEDGEWKHRFTEEELDLFMPGTSFEKFVGAQKEGGSSEGS